MAGNLDVTWIHGAPDCATSTDAPIQVHRFDSDTFIFRQSKCSDPGTIGQPGPSFEAPFLYLLIGNTRALLLDTGATPSPSRFPLAVTVKKILHDHAAALGVPTVPLLIAHSHSHTDHTAGDSQFQGSAEIVAPSLNAVKSFHGLPAWPNGVATLNLGARELNIIPIPGHEDAHIAVYDRNTKILLTGDSLYPGLLVVNDWKAYRLSIARLRAFCDNHPVSFVLGAHIEMTARPGRWFGLGALFQPDEHVLQLTRDHLNELDDALRVIGEHPRTARHPDFIIWPAGHPMPGLNS